MSVFKLHPSKESQLYLVCHSIRQKHDVTRVNAHTVGRHGVLNLVEHRFARRLDTQYLLHLHDMVRLCACAYHSLGSHHLFQTIPFDKQLSDTVLIADDSPSGRRNSLDDDLGQGALEELERVVDLLLVRAKVDADTVLFRDDSHSLKSTNRVGQHCEQTAVHACTSANHQLTSSLILSLGALTIAHLMSSRVTSS